MECNEIFKKKVGGNKGSDWILLPKEWREFYGLEKGDWVELELKNIIKSKEVNK